MGIFQVHDLVADIIGGLDEIDEGMTGELQGFAYLRLAGNAEFLGDAEVEVLLGIEESELAFLACS